MLKIKILFIDFGSDRKTSSWTRMWCWREEVEQVPQLLEQSCQLIQNLHQPLHQSYRSIDSFEVYVWAIPSNVCHWTQVSAES